MSTIRTPATADGERVLTGRKVLAMLLAFFGVMLVANIILTWQALTTFRGADTDSVYRSSIAYPTEIEAARLQAALGWRVDLHTERGTNGDVIVTLQPKDAAGATLPGLSIEARLEHPANRYLDRTLRLEEVETGLYRGAVAGVSAGGWSLSIDVDRGSERVWRSRNRLMLP